MFLGGWGTSRYQVQVVPDPEAQRTKQRLAALFQHEIFTSAARGRLLGVSTCWNQLL